VYSYDSIYQITEVNYPAGYEDTFTDTEFGYDAAGNRTTVIDAGGTSSYVTNALNQYTSVSGAAYAYDGNGNMTYDGDGMMYAYDPENRLTTVNKIDGPLSPGCDIALSFTSGGDAAWVLDTNEYSYDHDSARSGEIGDDQDTWLQTTVTGPGTLTFDYKLSCDAGDEYAFSIDGQYRSGRAGSKDWTQSGPWTITGAGVHTIRWKFIKDSSGSSGSDCLWIDRIRWTGAMPDGEGWDRIEYAYDAAGRRIEKKVDGTTQVKYVYDGSHILAEYNSAGTLLRKYVHGPCVDEPICMIEASGAYAGTHYYHYDALGSCVAMTNSAGNVVQLYEYSVYGQVAASDADHPNRFMFTGREFDKDTGLYYYRARYYHPEIGRFLQTDPIGYGDGMNLYRYCINNPLMWADPLGLAIGYSEPSNPPKTEWYDSYDKAAMAAAAWMQMRYDLNSYEYEMGVEQWSWIYEYDYCKSPEWRPGDPCLLYGFTAPVFASVGTVREETRDQQRNEVPPNCKIIGSVHSHGKNGGNDISQGDAGMAAGEAARQKNDHHLYVLGDEFNKDTGTQEQKLLVRTLWRRWNRDLQRFIYVPSEFIIAGYDPCKPPAPWERSNPAAQ
jgi:RHS repeat-associated protein